MKCRKEACPIADSWSMIICPANGDNVIRKEVDLQEHSRGSYLLRRLAEGQTINHREYCRVSCNSN